MSSSTHEHCTYVNIACNACHYIVTRIIMIGQTAIKSIHSVYFWTISCCVPCRLTAKPQQTISFYYTYWCRNLLIYKKHCNQGHDSQSLLSIGGDETGKPPCILPYVVYTQYRFWSPSLESTDGNVACTKAKASFLMHPIHYTSFRSSFVEKRHAVLLFTPRIRSGGMPT